MTVSRRDVLKGLVAAGAVAGAGSAGAREQKQAAADAVGMLYDSTRCVGCRACVTRCRQANDLPATRGELDGGWYDAPADLDATTKSVIKLYAGADQTAFVKAQCMHCVDPACVSVCMIQALHKGDGGIVAYEKERCVGCRYCQVACAFNVPKFAWSSATPQIVKCELCRHRADPRRGGALAVANPACCEVCPREAVVYGRRADLLAEAKRRIGADPSRYERRVYGENDGGGTQVLYLAAKGVPFEKLGLPELGSEPVPALSESIQHGVYYGFLAPVALFAAARVAVARNGKHDGGEGQS